MYSQKTPASSDRIRSSVRFINQSISPAWNERIFDFIFLVCRHGLHETERLAAPVSRCQSSRTDHQMGSFEQAVTHSLAKSPSLLLSFFHFLPPACAIDFSEVVFSCLYLRQKKLHMSLVLSWDVQSFVGKNFNNKLSLSIRETFAFAIGSLWLWILPGSEGNVG